MCIRDRLSPTGISNTRKVRSVRHVCNEFDENPKNKTPVFHRPKKKSFRRFTAHKKKSFRRFFGTNVRLEAPLPVYFSCTTFRHSATTSATLLIRKCTNRRWTLRCSHYSVAKRQQFSCPLSTATLSLKF